MIKLCCSALLSSNRFCYHFGHTYCAHLAYALLLSRHPAACNRGSLPSALPSRFAWLVGGLLLHGHLLLNELAGDSSVADGQELVGDMRQLALAAADSSPEDEPHSLVSSIAAGHVSASYIVNMKLISLPKFVSLMHYMYCCCCHGGANCIVVTAWPRT
jgi:hypothetical protein